MNSIENIIDSISEFAMKTLWVLSLIVCTGYILGQNVVSIFAHEDVSVVHYGSEMSDRDLAHEECVELGRGVKKTYLSLCSIAEEKSMERTTHEQGLVWMKDSWSHHFRDEDLFSLLTLPDGSHIKVKYIWE